MKDLQEPTNLDYPAIAGSYSALANMFDQAYKDLVTALASGDHQEQDFTMKRLALLSDQLGTINTRYKLGPA